MEKLKKHFSELWYMYVLGGLIILITVVYGNIINYEKDNLDDINAVYYMTDFEAADITAISYRNRMNNILSFVLKEDGTWIYEENPELPIEQAGPKYLVELVRKISTEYQVENAEDISIYGLSENCPYIEFVAKGETYRMYIGDYNETVKRYYANMAGSRDVYGVKVNVAEIFDFTLKHYMPEQ